MKIAPCEEQYHLIYCDICGYKPVLVENPRWDTTGTKAFGDVMCSNCHLVIGTISYDLKELPPLPNKDT